MGSRFLVSNKFYLPICSNNPQQEDMVFEELKNSNVEENVDLMVSFSFRIKILTVFFFLKKRKVA